jgi:chromosome segregation ATPase
MFGDNYELKNLKLQLIEEKDKVSDLQKKLKDSKIKEKDYIREIDNLKDALDKAVIELAQLKRDIRYNKVSNKNTENNNEPQTKNKMERRESKKAVEIDDTEVFSL